MAEPKLTNILSGYQRKVQKQIRTAVKTYKEKEQSWQYLEVALTLFTILLFIIFAIRPTVLTISGLLGEIKEKEEISLRMRKKINNVLSAQEEYALVQERVALIDSFLPNKPSISQGITQVVGVSGASAIDLSPISLSSIDFISEKQKLKRSKKTDTAAAANIESINLILGASGSYEHLRNFIVNLLSVRRYIAVDRYQVSANKDEDVPGLSLSVGARLIYWLNKQLEI